MIETHGLLAQFAVLLSHVLGMSIDFIGIPPPKKKKERLFQQNTNRTSNHGPTGQKADENPRKSAIKKDRSLDFTNSSMIFVG